MGLLGSRSARDLLEEMPMKDKGEREQEKVGSLQTVVQGGREGPREGGAGESLRFCLRHENSLETDTGGDHTTL